MADPPDLHQQSYPALYHIALDDLPDLQAFPWASKTGVPDTPSILAFQRCTQYFLLLVPNVGQFSELTPVCRQARQGWLPTLGASDSAFDINRSNGGKQRKQKDTIIPINNPKVENFRR